METKLKSADIQLVQSQNKERLPFSVPRRSFLKFTALLLTQASVPFVALSWVGTRMRKGVAASSVTPGSQSFTSPGSGNFTVPAHNWIDIELWGGGGSGGEDYMGSNGNAGTASTCNGLSAGGGGGGKKGASGICPGGTGGVAAGGDTNTSGTDGGVGQNSISPPFAGAGGDSPNGGNGGSAPPLLSFGDGSNGGIPGGGGGGCLDEAYGLASAGGGGGAYCKKRYLAGTLTPGSSLSYTVGAGGASPNDGGTRKAGKGGDGTIKFTWG